MRSFEKQLVGDVREAASSFMDEATAERLYQERRAMELERVLTNAPQQEEA